MTLAKHEFQPLKFKVNGSDQPQYTDWCGYTSPPRPPLSPTAISETDFCWQQADAKIHQVEEVARDDA